VLLAKNNDCPQGIVNLDLLKNSLQIAPHAACHGVESGGVADRDSRQ
jgi:hypothetical protein